MPRTNTPSRSFFRLRTATTVLLASALASGCLSNSYRIRQDELVRLSQLPPEQRWQAVRAVQHLAGSDTPPNDAPPPSAPGTGMIVRPAIVATVPGDPGVVVGPGLPPPPRLPLPGVTPPAFANASTSHAGSGGGGGGGSGGGGSGGGSGGDGALLIAAVVIGVAVAVAILIPTEGMRYDGWVAVNPDEWLYLRAQNGDRLTMPLSQLTPDIAQASSSADIYEGPQPRFARLARAPLDRRDFGMSAAFLVSGVPQLDRSRSVGLGGHVNLSWNIANLVSLGASADASASSPTSGGSTLSACVGPEVIVTPLTWVGAYAGGGWAYRDTWSMTSNETRNGGFYLRAGMLGELPLSTRLSLQLRTGAMLVNVGDGVTPFTWEASLGFGVY
jgi:hypothetical protein